MYEYQFSVLRLAIGLVFLSCASLSDLRTRRVENTTWVLMGITGFFLLGLQLYLDSKLGQYYLMLVPIGVLFFDAYVDRAPLIELKQRQVNYPFVLLYIASFVVIGYELYLFHDDYYFIQLIVIVAMLLLSYLFYYTGLLHGGADAKALMSISVFAPVYPTLAEPLPLIHTDPFILKLLNHFFPFPLLVLMNSALLMLFVPLGLAVYNIFRRDYGFPEMLFGYRLELGLVRRKFVWLMERIEADGEHVLTVFPAKVAVRKKDIELLQKAGVKRPWVTPQFPFIVAMTLGYTVSFLVGNIFLGILELFI